MGLPINVHELIESRVVESSRIEYKADWNPEPIVHTITAFANDVDAMGGGYVVAWNRRKTETPGRLFGRRKEKVRGEQKDVFASLSFSL